MVMPVPYETKTFRVTDLTLDPKNPRFIEPLDEPTQDAIREHLLKYEKVNELAASIDQYGGLMPGERMIVTKEDDDWVVLEGNRRVCACQLLLNPSLYPAGHKPVFALQSTKDAIAEVDVDVVRNRNDAAPILASRHIEGIERWETLAKMKFFVSRFESGETVDRISNLTKVSKPEITKSIRSYYLLKRALDLPVWTKEERTGPLDWYKIEPVRYIRIFSTDKARERLKIRFDSKTNKPVSGLPDDEFDHALTLIARATLIGDIGTRSKLRDIPGMYEFMEKIGTPLDPPSVFPGAPKEGDRKAGKPPTEQSPADQERSVKWPDIGGLANESSGDSWEKQPEQPEKSPKPGIPKDVGFFESLTCDLNPGDADSKGIIAIAREIRSISKPHYLEVFPNAAGMLMRSLVEQALKLHLKKRASNILSKFEKKDPTLRELLNLCDTRLDKIFDKDTARLYKAVFQNDGIKESLDLVIHSTHLTAMTPTTLTSIAKVGMCAFVQTLIRQ